jgi:hypothetical protein
LIKAIFTVFSYPDLNEDSFLKGLFFLAISRFQMCYLYVLTTINMPF